MRKLPLHCIALLTAVALGGLAAAGRPNLVLREKADVAVARDQVALLIKRAGYSRLSKEIEQYKRDVEARFPVRIHVVQGGWVGPEEVRTAIKSLRRTLKVSGVVLVGAVPMHKFHMHDFDNPNPLFYEAPDLRFVDSNGDGIADAYVGRPELKLWVANLRGVEGENDEGTEVLRTFLNKTHAYYAGATKIERRALAVTDSDWPEGANIFSENVGQPLFGKGNVDVLNCKEATAKSIYDAFSKHAYTLFYVQLHSTPTRQDTSQGSLLSKDIAEIPTGALFTVNHGCSNCNWAKNQTLEKGRNTGMSWVFGKGVGQAVVGNVRTGMVYGQEALYARILAGDYLGKAYLAGKAAAEEEMHREYPNGDVVAGVLFIGNPFLYLKPQK
jgi:hypothetical protein